jgi:N-acetylglutamate synthase-like GNAT family acetyltransferase
MVMSAQQVALCCIQLNTQLDTAQKILELITPFVKQDKILPRTHTQINDNINDFVLLEQSGTLASRKSVLLQLGQW